MAHHPARMDSSHSDSASALRRWFSEQGGRLEADAAGGLQRLEGGASPRTYWRVPWAEGPDGGPGRAIVMALPEDALAPTEHGAMASGELPWLVMQRRLEAAGVPVPRVYRADVTAGFLLIEDLGDVRLFDQVTADPNAAAPLYDAAVDLLGRWQAALGGATIAAPTFDAAHLRAELDEFVAMGLEARLGVALTPSERQVFARAGDVLVDELVGGPRLLAHRDFQSQNLMLTPRGLVLIDFQDAFCAPDVYDLVALLRDSYVELPPSEVSRLVARFASLSPEPSLVAARFDLQTIQRKLKDAGRFETLARRGKPGFLRYFGRSIRYVVGAIASLGRFEDLLEVLVSRLPEAREAMNELTSRGRGEAAS